MSLKDLYNQNVNIMEYFRKTNNTDKNSINAILASYDLQAGSYIKVTKQIKNQTIII